MAISKVSADFDVTVDLSVNDGTPNRLVPVDCLPMLEARLDGFALWGIERAHCETVDPSYLRFFELLFRSQ